MANANEVEDATRKFESCISQLRALSEDAENVITFHKTLILWEIKADNLRTAYSFARSIVLKSLEKELYLYIYSQLSFWMQALRNSPNFSNVAHILNNATRNLKSIFNRSIGRDLETILSYYVSLLKECENCEQGLNSFPIDKETIEAQTLALLSQTSIESGHDLRIYDRLNEISRTSSFDNGTRRFDPKCGMSYTPSTYNRQQSPDSVYSIGSVSGVNKEHFSSSAKTSANFGNMFTTSSRDRIDSSVAAPSLYTQPPNLETGNAARIYSSSARTGRASVNIDTPRLAGPVGPHTYNRPAQRRDSTPLEGLVQQKLTPTSTERNSDVFTPISTNFMHAKLNTSTFSTGYRSYNVSNESPALPPQVSEKYSEIRTPISSFISKEPRDYNPVQLDINSPKFPNAEFSKMTRTQPQNIQREIPIQMPSRPNVLDQHQTRTNGNANVPSTSTTSYPFAHSEFAEPISVEVSMGYNQPKRLDQNSRMPSLPVKVDLVGNATVYDRSESKPSMSESLKFFRQAEQITQQNDQILRQQQDRAKTDFGAESDEEFKPMISQQSSQRNHQQAERAITNFSVENDNSFDPMASQRSFQSNSFMGIGFKNLDEDSDESPQQRTRQPLNQRPRSHIEKMRLDSDDDSGEGFAQTKSYDDTYERRGSRSSGNMRIARSLSGSRNSVDEPNKRYRPLESTAPANIRRKSSSLERIESSYNSGQMAPTSIIRGSSSRSTEIDTQRKISRRFRPRTANQPKILVGPLLYGRKESYDFETEHSRIHLTSGSSPVRNTSPLSVEVEVPIRKKPKENPAKLPNLQFCACGHVITPDIMKELDLIHRQTGSRSKITPLPRPHSHTPRFGDHLPQNFVEDICNHAHYISKNGETKSFIKPDGYCVPHVCRCQPFRNLSNLNHARLGDNEKNIVFLEHVCEHCQKDLNEGSLLRSSSGFKYSNKSRSSRSHSGISSKKERRSHSEHGHKSKSRSSEGSQKDPERASSRYSQKSCSPSQSHKKSNRKHRNHSKKSRSSSRNSSKKLSHRGSQLSKKSLSNSVHSLPDKVNLEAFPENKSTNLDRNMSISKTAYPPSRPTSADRLMSSDSPSDLVATKVAHVCHQCIETICQCKNNSDPHGLDHTIFANRAFMRSNNALLNSRALSRSLSRNSSLSVHALHSFQDVPIMN